MEMTKEKLAEYLLFFAKFDYALVRSSFYKKGRKIQNNVYAADADWDKFIKKLPGDFFEEISRDHKCREIIDNPPRTYGIDNDNGPQKFFDEKPVTDAESLIYACKHVRNNLVHGEKLQKDTDDVERNYSLLNITQQILLKAMDDIPDMRRIFDDIPY